MRKSQWWYVVLLLLVVSMAVGCGKKKPPVVEEQVTPTTPGEGEGTQVIKPDDGTSPYGDKQPKEPGYGDLPDPYNLKPVYFDFDRYDIRPDAADALSRYAQVLQKNPEVKLRLEGHCDERDTIEYNLALGERRSNAVYRYLIDLGVASNRLSTISYGEEFPADPRHSEDAWAKNRRVEFKVAK